MVSTLLAIAPAAIAQAQPSSIVPVTPEVTVSPITYTAAAGAQSGTRAASNGEVTLVAWSDTRAGGYQVFACRIDHDGRALDPLGIPLGVTFGPTDVVWNGDAFAVLATVADGNQVLVLVSVDGVILGQRAIGMPNGQYVAASGRGADVRLLFIQNIQPGGAATVLDGEGNLVGSSAPLWKLLDGYTYARVAVGGPSPTGFLLLHEELADTQNPARTIVATRLDRNGNPIGSAEAHLPFNVLDGTEGVQGGSDGFLMVTQKWIKPAAVAFRLDLNGVYNGETTLAAADPADRLLTYRPQVEWDGQEYVVAWHSSLQNGHSYVRLATVAEGSSAATVHEIADYVGITTDVSLAHGVAQPLLFTSAWHLGWSSGADVFVQPFTASGAATPPQAITFTATRQRQAHVAATRNGYAVAWSETGPDSYVRLFVRRFGADGTPFDPQPMEAARSTADPLPGRVVSNGATYAVLWAESGKLLIRRLADLPGEWLDAQPVAAGSAATAFASDEKDVLAIGVAQCGTPWEDCIASQRISLTGELTVSTPLTVGTPGAPYNAAVASNGTDYLVVWSDGNRQCVTLCPTFPPFRLLAMRLRADGTAIDSAPIVLENANGYPDRPSVAWNGGRYVVVWVNGSEIRGATVTAEGAVLDVDPSNGGAVLHDGGCCTGLTPTVVALGSGFVLLTRGVAWSNGSIVHPVSWEGVAFCGDCDLRDVAAMPRTMLLQLAAEFGSLDATAVPGGLVLAYDRPAGADAGFVPRVFSRTFAPAVRRRAVMR